MSSQGGTSGSRHGTSFEIGPMTGADWPAVREIYAEGITTGNATFEVETPDWQYWNASHLASCRLVARRGSTTLGWAALGPVSRRKVYSGVAEVSVYVTGPAQGQRVGSKLLAALVQGSEEQGIWTLQATIFPENVASLKLHERHGFRVVGVRERLGCRNGVWRDVVLVERRSDMVGT